MAIAAEVMDRQQIGAWIRRNRKRKGWSAAQLAVTHLGMRSAGLVEKWERGVTAPGGLYMIRLITLFDEAPPRPADRPTLEKGIWLERPRLVGSMPGRRAA